MSAKDATNLSEKWDVFICHASEDKETFVRPLAVALRSLGVSVWYDEFSLQLGDSISRSIDKGIANSKHGLVVVSVAFLSKRWPEHELQGLVHREISEDTVIVPVWLGVEDRDVAEFSPSLADKLAIVITYDSDMVDIALRILRVVRPDLYDRHPRAQLARIASGEAMAELQQAINDLSERLAPFECPTCGAPLLDTVRIQHEYGGDKRQIFECGYHSGGGKPCPLDPTFPLFEDYELECKYRPDESRRKWKCVAKPRTAMAKRLGAFSGLGSTEDEARQNALDEYKRRAQPWKRP